MGYLIYRIITFGMGVIGSFAKFLLTLHSSNVESILAAEVYLNGLSGQELIVNY